MKGGQNVQKYTFSKKKSITVKRYAGQLITTCITQVFACLVQYGIVIWVFSSQSNELVSQKRHGFSGYLWTQQKTRFFRKSLKNRQKCLI